MQPVARQGKCSGAGSSTSSTREGSVGIQLLSEPESERNSDSGDKKMSAQTPPAFPEARGSAVAIPTRTTRPVAGRRRRISQQPSQLSHRQVSHTNLGARRHVGPSPSPSPPPDRPTHASTLAQVRAPSPSHHSIPNPSSSPNLLQSRRNSCSVSAKLLPSPRTHISGGAKVLPMPQRSRQLSPSSSTIGEARIIRNASQQTILLCKSQSLRTFSI